MINGVRRVSRLRNCLRENRHHCSLNCCALKNLRYSWNCFRCCNWIGYCCCNWSCFHCYSCRMTLNCNCPTNCDRSRKNCCRKNCYGHCWLRAGG